MSFIVLIEEPTARPTKVIREQHFAESGVLAKPVINYPDGMDDYDSNYWAGNNRVWEFETKKQVEAVVPELVKWFPGYEIKVFALSAVAYTTAGEVQTKVVEGNSLLPF